MQRRVGPYVAAALLCLVGFGVVHEVNESPIEQLDGECVRFDGDSMVTTSCFGPRDAKIVGVLMLESDEICPFEADDAFVSEEDPTRVICLDYGR